MLSSGLERKEEVGKGEIIQGLSGRGNEEVAGEEMGGV